MNETRTYEYGVTESAGPECCSNCKLSSLVPNRASPPSRVLPAVHTMPVHLTFPYMLMTSYIVQPLHFILSTLPPRSYITHPRSKQHILPHRLRAAICSVSLPHNTNLSSSHIRPASPGILSIRRCGDAPVARSVAHALGWDVGCSSDGGVGVSGTAVVVAHGTRSTLAHDVTVLIRGRAAACFLALMTLEATLRVVADRLHKTHLVLWLLASFQEASNNILRFLADVNTSSLFRLKASCPVMYAVMTKDGSPTDRCLAEGWCNSNVFDRCWKDG